MWFVWLEDQSLQINGANLSMINEQRKLSPCSTLPFEMRRRNQSQNLAAGGSALLDAVNKGKVHLAKFILDAADCDVVNTRDFNGKTPIIRACYIKVRCYFFRHESVKMINAYSKNYDYDIVAGQITNIFNVLNKTKYTSK